MKSKSKVTQAVKSKRKIEVLVRSSKSFSGYGERFVHVLHFPPTALQIKAIKKAILSLDIPCEFEEHNLTHGTHPHINHGSYIAFFRIRNYGASACDLDALDRALQENNYYS